MAISAEPVIRYVLLQPISDDAALLHFASAGGLPFRSVMSRLETVSWTLINRDHGVLRLLNIHDPLLHLTFSPPRDTNRLNEMVDRHARSRSFGTCRRY